jgi:hypothetical protein
MKPNFLAMSKAQLRAYVLEHREDKEAFQALADKILENPHLNWYDTQDLANFPELLAHQQKLKQNESN